MKEYIDLHTHTKCSDGLLAPKALIKKAKSYGLKAIAICDHDTIQAYDDRNVFTYANKMKVELVPGIEFSTTDENTNKYHILGLFINLNDENLKKIIKKIQNQRNSYVKKVCNLLRKDKWNIEERELLESGASITKAHISRALLSNKKNISKITKIFSNIPSEGTFTEKLLIKGGKYFIPNENKISPKQAINTIHLAKGVAILAHPGFNVMNGENLEKLCNKFKNLGIDGFEAINIQFNKSNKDARIDYVKKFETYCRKHNLLITGGSDFHHSNKKLMGKFIDLGFKNDKYKVIYNLLKKIKTFLKNKNI